MKTPDLISVALKRVRTAADTRHAQIVSSSDILRTDREILLASGGYPWTVVRVDHRNQYISTLEDTHIHFDMTDFTNFIKQEMLAS